MRWGRADNAAAEVSSVCVNVCVCVTRWDKREEKERENVATTEMFNLLSKRFYNYLYLLVIQVAQNALLDILHEFKTNLKK